MDKKKIHAFVKKHSEILNEFILKYEHDIEIVDMIKTMKKQLVLDSQYLMNLGKVSKDDEVKWTKFVNLLIQFEKELQ